MNYAEKYTSSQLEYYKQRVARLERMATPKKNQIVALSLVDKIETIDENQEKNKNTACFQPINDIQKARKIVRRVARLYKFTQFDLLKNRRFKRLCYARASAM